MMHSALHQFGRLLLLALVATGALRLYAQGPWERIPLTDGMVASALGRSGLTVTASQIEMPLALTAGSRDPQLRVTAADLVVNEGLRVRMACHQTSDCLPFLVTVHFASAPESFRALAALRGNQGGDADNPPTRARRLVAGQHATLLLEDPHMRIAFEIIAIDSGSPGSEVRVSSLDRKQLFRAVVVDAGTVRGTLP